MGKKLTKNVYVDGELHKAGSEPDKAVADKITNPAAWSDDDSEAAAADADEKPAKRTTSRKSD